MAKYQKRSPMERQI